MAREDGAGEGSRISPSLTIIHEGREKRREGGRKVKRMAQISYNVKVCYN